MRCMNRRVAELVSLDRVSPLGLSRDEVRGGLGGFSPAGTEVVVGAQLCDARGSRHCDAPGCGLLGAARGELAAVFCGKNGVRHDVVSPGIDGGGECSKAPGCTGGATDG